MAAGAPGWVTTFRRALRITGAAADAVDENFGSPGPLAGALGLAKVVASAAALPVLGPATVAVALRNTARAQAVTRRYPQLVTDALTGSAAPPFDDIAFLDADQPVVITSDLHRCIAGSLDWPTHQGTRHLYEAVLDHYAASSWHLVENGDVEDFWMVGGSSWGALYDVARLSTGWVPGPVGRRARAALYGEHLRRIVDCNAGIYARIEDGFARHDRYHRVIGNHDDVYSDPLVAEELARVHAGVRPLDALVLTSAEQPVALVTHGHQTDGWNGPGMAGLGRLFTWLGCAVQDAPVPVAMPGLPRPSDAQELLDGLQRNVLTAVDRWVGATTGLYTLDEVAMYDAFLTALDGGDAEELAYLILGHTHVALSGPEDPDGRARWERYVNIGSGVGWQLVTAVEWAATTPGRAPGPQLVAWYLPEPGASPLGDVVAATPDGREVAKVTLGPSPTPSVLSCLAGGDR